jgi:hypothetical protein
MKWRARFFGDTLFQDSLLRSDLLYRRCEAVTAGGQSRVSRADR